MGASGSVNRTVSLASSGTGKRSKIWSAGLSKPALISGRLGRSLIDSALGPLLSQGVSLALVPFLFRLYTPSDFGAWATTQAVVVIAGSLVPLRLDLGIVVERDPAAASNLFWTAITVVCFLMLFFGGVSALSSTMVHGIGVTVISATLGWTWLSLLAIALVLQAWLLREGRFADVSAGAVLNTVTTNVMQLAGSVHSDGIWLIVGSLSGQLVATLSYAWSIYFRSERPSCSLSVVEMIACFARNRRFLQFSLPFTVLSLIRERVPIFVIGAYGGPVLLGLYSQAWRLTHLPSGFTSAALRPVFFHRAATEGLAHQRHAVDQIVRWLLLASSPWIALLAFGGEQLSTIVLGFSWRGTGELAAILVTPAALFAITNWMDRLLDVAGRQDMNLKLESLSGISSVVALWGVLATGGSLVQAVTAQSVALSINYLILLCICYVVAGWPMFGLVLSMIVAFATGAAFFIALTFVHYLFADSTALQGGAFAAGVMTLAISLRAIKVFR